MAPLIAAALLFDGFAAAQYAPKAVSLRGCAECRGEPDDVCEVRPGVQVQALSDYARQRWPAPGRLKLLRPSAEASCAVAGKSVLGARAPVQLFALRIASGPPAPSLLEKLSLRGGVRGWPRRQARTFEAGAAPERAALRAAIVCWPAERGWPMPLAAGAADARAAPDAANACERWLVAVDAAGEPDPSGLSFAVAAPAVPATSAQWPQAFGEAGQAAAKPPPPPLAPPPERVPQCADSARERTATLDRFDQWDLQIRGAARPTLDRASLTLAAAPWSGHCQELDVLRAALERQLECTLRTQGSCASVESR